MINSFGIVEALRNSLSAFNSAQTVPIEQCQFGATYRPPEQMAKLADKGFTVLNVFEDTANSNLTANNYELVFTEQRYGVQVFFKLVHSDEYDEYSEKQFLEAKDMVLNWRQYLNAVSTSSDGLQSITSGQLYNFAFENERNKQRTARYIYTILYFRAKRRVLEL